MFQWLGLGLATHNPNPNTYLTPIQVLDLGVRSIMFPAVESAAEAAAAVASTRYPYPYP